MLSRFQAGMRMSLIPAPLRDGFERLLQPLVDTLIARQASPNAITTVGTGVLIASGAAYAAVWPRWGGALLLASGVCDMLDGRVARGGGRTTKFGAFYDSTLDRVGEAALFGGIALGAARGLVAPSLVLPAVTLAMTGLSAGLIVSYARARAEGLGLECKVGMAQRAERIVGLGVPTLFFGAGPRGLLLLAIVALLALAAGITVVQRIVHVYRATRTAPPRATQARRLTGELAPYISKGPPQ
jgi:CDP-diacylglycerol--glycerol-3-phosphate 3-phosphatidyltransferase